MTAKTSLMTAAPPPAAARAPEARTLVFCACALAVLALGAVLTQTIANPYVFFAAFIIVQQVALATGWNVLGGYAGYINFGATAFYGAGAYTGAFLLKAYGASIFLCLPAAALVGGGLGLLMGYMTLRVQGVYFAIATIALVVMMHTLVLNIDYLGGASGLALMPPEPPAWTGGQVQFVFLVMLGIAVLAVACARWIEISWVGRGFRALRASEEAAECAGVPTFRLKLSACAISGAILAMTGAPLVFYASFIEPETVFGLALALNAIAMPLIGGKKSWPGPIIGAVLLGSVQQAATITISSELNILLVGVVLIGFVAAAPDGILGLVDTLRKGRQ
ncbi:branched-chain amino acid ABC transporter permease [Azorhizobium doebereinerae]|uniref:branched-chain amino acid ABC transporter permease n=1 Tax=Azorhizobium doebereinerae TaxID=281091 RepID=UPI000412B17D|nr:branched-chain amino acid ABC transporter permease [Azorhizobium doebereinerae]